MKVLHVIPAVAPRYGGPSAALPALCTALRRHGIDTTIASTDADGDAHLPFDLGIATTYQGTAAIFFRRQFSESFKYSRPLAGWLAHNAGSFDVVHVHAVLSHACLAAGRACRLNGVPYIVRPLGTLDPWSLRQKAAKKRLLMWAAGRRLLAGAAAIHYTSRQEKALVEGSLGLTNGVVIPLGVDDSVLVHRDGRREAAATSRPYVLAMSRLHPKKGLEALVDAFAALHATGGELADWRLIIAGDGDAAYVQQLKAFAAARGTDGSIEFAGWVEGEAKRALLDGAALFAAPSSDENFGVSLVEALACGVPAIVSPSVHLACDIEAAAAGWLAPPGSHLRTSLFAAPPGSHLKNSLLAADRGQTNEPNLRTVLERAMLSPEERTRRGQAARLLAQRFAWSKVAADVAELYARVASPLRVSPAEPRADRGASGSR